MYIKEETIDDILYKLYTKILSEGKPITNRKGPNKEILGVYIRLQNPLNRISRSFTRGRPISPIGEFLWYMSGSDDLEIIKYYLPNYEKFSDDNKTLYGAYGKRLLNKDGEINQIDSLVEKLKASPSTRQAVMQIYDAKDLLITSKDIPCTCTLQFVIREGKLNLFTTMRSNDAFKGFIHDVFSFTMIQEIISKLLDVELGDYNHFVSSMHLYNSDEGKIRAYLAEGYQSTKFSMLPMPGHNIESSIGEVLKWEKKIRNGYNCNAKDLDINDYWKDIIILLQIHAIYKGDMNKKEKKERIMTLADQFKTLIFKILIEEKHK